jgi:hypothetical protein
MSFEGQLRVTFVHRQMRFKNEAKGVWADGFKLPALP